MLKISNQNSSTSPLASGGSFIGTGEDVSNYSTIRIAVRSDSGASGTIYAGFSPDGSSWTETPYTVADPSVHVPFTIRVTATYFRLRYVNGGASQTTFRIQSLYDSGSSVVTGGGGGGGGSVNVVRQVITLSSGMVAAKSFNLASAPANPSTVDIIPYGGLKQRYLVDFDVNSNIISWAGLGLDGTLDVNDVLEVTYST